MGRNVMQHMEQIFSKLEEAISDEDRFRIEKTKRHINPSGDKSKVIDFVKYAKTLSIPIESFKGCLYSYQGKNYILVPGFCSSALTEMGLNELVRSEENEAIEIIQGCEMLAISKGVLEISNGTSSLEIIDKCLGLRDSTSEDIVFEFTDIRELFDSCSIFDLDESIFGVIFMEDLLRLCGYCICNTSSAISNNAKKTVKNILLLTSSRSISASIINGLRSPIKEYTFLQLYQCLEYLFRLNNSFDIQKKYSTNVKQAINIVLDYDFKLSECENLRRVIVNHVVENDIDDFINRAGWAIQGNDSKESKCNFVSENIYKIRCEIAHLRYGQAILKDQKWNELTEAMVELILHIYEKCDSQIVQTCTTMNAWEDIRYESIN